jgi:hypothetical protein
MPIALTPSVLARRKSLLLFAPPPSSDTIATGPDPVSEINAYQIDSSASGDAHVVLRVRTQTGLVGYGECNALSAADLKATSQAVVGHAPSAYQALDGLAPPAVRGGLNIALLDIVGKATKAPIYRVLGGPTRNKARAITRLSGSSDEALQSDLEKQLTAGFRAFLIPVPLPTARNQGSEFVRVAAARLKAMRASAPAADFAFEAHAKLTPADAASLAAEVESMHPLWFDEPCPVSNLETIRKSQRRPSSLWVLGAPSPILEPFRICFVRDWSICFDPIFLPMASPGSPASRPWRRPTTWLLRHGIKAERLPMPRHSTLPQACPTSSSLNPPRGLGRRRTMDSSPCRRAQD